MIGEHVCSECGFEWVGEFSSCPECATGGSEVVGDPFEDAAEEEIEAEDQADADENYREDCAEELSDVARSDCPSGIYAIENLKTGRTYVGSSVNLKDRWTAHRNLLRCGAHKCTQLQADWASLGEGAFAFRVLEQVSEAGLDRREQAHLHRLFRRVLKPYNSPDSPRSHPKTREEVRDEKTRLAAAKEESDRIRAERAACMSPAERAEAGRVGWRRRRLAVNWEAAVIAFAPVMGLVDLN